MNCKPHLNVFQQMRDSIKRQLRSGKLLLGGHPSKSLQCVPYAQIPHPLRMAGVLIGGGGGRIFSSQKPTKLVHLDKFCKGADQNLRVRNPVISWGGIKNGTSPNAQLPMTNC